MQCYVPMAELGQRIERITDTVPVAWTEPQFADRATFGLLKRDISIWDDQRPDGTELYVLTFHLSPSRYASLVDECATVLVDVDAKFMKRANFLFFAKGRMLVGNQQAGE